MKPIKLSNRTMPRAKFIRINPQIQNLVRDEEGLKLITAVFAYLNYPENEGISMLYLEKLIKLEWIDEGANILPEVKQLLEASFTLVDNEYHYHYPVPLCKLQDGRLFLEQDAKELSAILFSLQNLHFDVFKRLKEDRLELRDWERLKGLSLLDDRGILAEEVKEFLDIQVIKSGSRYEILPTKSFTQGH